MPGIKYYQKCYDLGVNRRPRMVIKFMYAEYHEAHSNQIVGI